jgi:hypothetical protein
MGDGHLLRNEVFVATAVVGAHVNGGSKGFRQRDVRFLIELYSNWVESALGVHTIPVQNTQVLRYLEHLVGEGHARRLARRTHPYYRLSKTGLLELLRRLVDREGDGPRESFFFLYYFVRSYRERLCALVESEGKQASAPIRAEMEALLDVKALVSRELLVTEREIENLERRIDEAKRASAQLRDGLGSGTPLSSCVRDIERRFPHALHTQRELSDLLLALPEDEREWELTVGNDRRVVDIWSPSKLMLETYRATLTRLGNEED